MAVFAFLIEFDFLAVHVLNCVLQLLQGQVAVLQRAKRSNYFRFWHSSGHHRSFVAHSILADDWVLLLAGCELLRLGYWGLTESSSGGILPDGLQLELLLHLLNTWSLLVFL